MRKLTEIAEALTDNDSLPIGILTGGGVIYGLLVSETVFQRETKSSLQKSSRGGGGFFSGHDGSMYRHILNEFDTHGLGADFQGESLPLIHSAITTGMMSAEVPTMRVNPKQVVSWWVTEHKIEGATFQGGGVGVGF